MRVRCGASTIQLTSPACSAAPSLTPLHIKPSAPLAPPWPANPLRSPTAPDPIFRQQAMNHCSVRVTQACSPHPLAPNQRGPQWPTSLQSTHDAALPSQPAPSQPTPSRPSPVSHSTCTPTISFLFKPPGSMLNPRPTIFNCCSSPPLSQ